MLLLWQRYYYSILQVRELTFWREFDHTPSKWQSQNPYSGLYSFVYFILFIYWCSYIKNTVCPMYCFQIKEVDDFQNFCLEFCLASPLHIKFSRAPPATTLFCICSGHTDVSSSNSWSIWNQNYTDCYLFISLLLWFLIVFSKQSYFRI